MVHNREEKIQRTVFILGCTVVKASPNEGYIPEGHTFISQSTDLHTLEEALSSPVTFRQNLVLESISDRSRLTLKSYCTGLSQISFGDR